MSRVKQEEEARSEEEAARAMVLLDLADVVTDRRHRLLDVLHVTDTKKVRRTRAQEVAGTRTAISIAIATASARL